MGDTWIILVRASCGFADDDIESTMSEECNHDPSDVSPDGPQALTKLGAHEPLTDRERAAADEWVDAYIMHDGLRPSTTMGGTCRVCGENVQRGDDLK